MTPSQDGVRKQRSSRLLRWRNRVPTLVVVACLAVGSVAGAASAAAAPAEVSFEPAPPCEGGGRTVVQPIAPGQVLDSQWEDTSPPREVTHDLSGVTSTAYPATVSPFAVGSARPGLRTCVVGGTVLGQADDAKPWHWYHDRFNASCLRIVSSDWMQVRGLRCDNVEDGIRMRGPRDTAEDAEIYVSGTYLSRIRDDCLENDHILGGLVQDSLWESCNTGISERPSSGRTRSTPSSEVLVLDHVLIGLYATPHVQGGKTVMGANALFKWSAAGNRVVIRCSVFKVEAMSLNGPRAMAFPPGTVVDDSACPGNPSAVVWLGGGDYPASTAGIRVVTDPAVWNNAVVAWKVAHGHV